jgi:hypothetical protein
VSGEQTKTCLHSIIRPVAEQVDGKRSKLVRIECARCGLRFEPVTERPEPSTAYVQRQTARRLIESVARQLTHEAGRTNNATEHQHRKAQAETLRDALSLLVGDSGTYPFEPDAGEVG